MKKICIGVLFSFVFVLLSACSEQSVSCENSKRLEDGECVTLQSSTNNDQPTENQPTENQPAIDVEEDVTISLWHPYFLGDAKEELELLIDAFEVEYPNISVEIRSDWQTSGMLFNDVQSAHSAGLQPNLVISETNEYNFLYENDVIVASLDDYINHPTSGIDITNFIPGLLDTSIASDGSYIGLPFSMVSEIVVYNKTVFDAHNIVIPDDEILTWKDFLTYQDLVLGSGDNQCDYLFNTEVPHSFFLAMNKMYGEDRRDLMLTESKSYYDQQVIVSPMNFDNLYNSTLFQSGDICMSTSSVDGLKYMMPNDDAFDLGFTMMPLYDETNKTYLATGKQMIMLKHEEENEQNATWLLMKFLLRDEQVSNWATSRNYLPVTYSAMQSSEYIEYLDVDGLSGVDYYKIVAQNILIQQVDSYFTTKYSYLSYRELGDYYDSFMRGYRTLEEFIDLVNQEAPNFYD